MKLLLVDANSLAHRAFHALPLLSTREGIFTNAVYGFTTMLQKALAIVKPDYVATSFDHGKDTFRTELCRDYKGHRPETAVELRPQFELIKRLLRAMNIAIFECPGYEADDIIGTLTAEAEKKDMECLILTGDKDALQLVGPRTSVLLMRRGLSEFKVWDLKQVREEYGLEPQQLIDVKALMGDPSDNIPGVPGIGEKTAVQLIREYGDLDGVLANSGQIKRNKIAQAIEAFSETARLARKLATIKRDVPLVFDLEECRYRSPHYEELLVILKELEFTSLIKDVLAAMNVQEAKSAGHKSDPSFRSKILDGLDGLGRLLSDLTQREAVALYFIFDSPAYLTADLLALGLSWPGGSAALPIGDKHQAKEMAGMLEQLLSGETPLYYHDAKAALVWLGERGIKVKLPAGDTMVAGYLLNPTASRHDLPELCLEHLDLALVEGEDLALNAAHRAEAVLKLHEILAEKLDLAGMKRLYREVELPLVEVLAAMERAGMKVSLETLDLLGAEFDGGLEGLTAEIYRLAGEEFNINSSKQLANILFEKLGLPPLKKTKTGYSTDASVLEELADEHEIVRKIVEYRQVAKLKSTYIEGLKPLIKPETGRLHTTFNQTVTATGRLSSSEPNLQNIPIRLDLGRRLRKAFIPSSPDRLFLAADYSQIELRILAHISRDPVLQEAFYLGQDIHARTAAEVFGVPLDQVTAEMRRRAKAVNFGIIYGISDYGLARDLGINRQEARNYIERYFHRYAGVKQYLERVVEVAREMGYVSTILGRRRYLPDLFSPNRNVRSFGERTAMNTPIQGSAADLIKLAMVNIYAEIKERHLRTEMVLQVHDELIFDVPGEELREVSEFVKEIMEKVYPLAVPLKVDLQFGSNWYDLRPLLEE